MIRSFTAHTSEADDINIAVSELKERLDLGGKLLGNTVGILTCYADFISTGVCRAVCEAFPFNVVGATTLANAVRGGEDDIMLAMMVMTSDDVSFAAGLSEPISEESGEPLRESYFLAASSLPDKPKLMLSFAPLIMNISGDYFVKAFDEISGGVPNFGMMAVDHNEDYHESAVIYDGNTYADRYAFILLSGKVNPRFHVASISNEKIYREKGVVTSSHGNLLATVNNIPVLDYLAGLGLKKTPDGSIIGINSFPFVMDLNDGMAPIVRVMFAFTPDGFAVCGGEMPVGATLSVGAIDAAQVLETTELRLREAVESESHDCLLIFSCVGRYFSLGYNTAEEMNKLREIVDGTGIPYHFAYAGTELSPVYSNSGSGVAMNRSHNDTCVICAL